MEESHRASAARVRGLIECALHEPSAFRSALLEVPPTKRDAWLDLALGVGEVPDDGPELPRGCVPYLPCSVDDLLRVVEHAPVRGDDVFVDIGSGVGRAAAFVHLLTGAPAIGLEIQPRLVMTARALAARLPASRIPSIEGDATQLVGFITIGTVFFLYCPFSGERLEKVLANLEPIARTRKIRVCSVDMALPSCRWLSLEKSPRAGLEIYQSTYSYHATRRARTRRSSPTG